MAATEATKACRPCQDDVHVGCDGGDCDCSTCRAGGWLKDIERQVRFDEAHGFVPKPRKSGR